MLPNPSHDPDIMGLLQKISRYPDWESASGDTKVEIARVRLPIVLKRRQSTFENLSHHLRTIQPSGVDNNGVVGWLHWRDGTIAIARISLI